MTPIYNRHNLEEATGLKLIALDERQYSYKSMFQRWVDAQRERLPNLKSTRPPESHLYLEGRLTLYSTPDAKSAFLEDVGTEFETNYLPLRRYESFGPLLDAVSLLSGDPIWWRPETKQRTYNHLIPVAFRGRFLLGILDPIRYLSDKRPVCRLTSEESNAFWDLFENHKRKYEGLIQGMNGR